MRVQVFLENLTGQYCFEMISQSENRLTWDERIQSMEDVRREGNEVVKYYLIPNQGIPFVSPRDVVVRQ